MRPAVELGDAERVTVDALVAAGLTGVSPDYPSSTLTSTATRLQVELESSNIADYPITERAQVRVVGHAAPGRRTAVKDLAESALRALYTATSSDVAAFVPLLGRSAVTTDPATRNVMCWVLVRVDLLAHPAA